MTLPERERRRLRRLALRVVARACAMIVKTVATTNSEQHERDEREPRLARRWASASARVRELAVSAPPRARRSLEERARGVECVGVALGSARARRAAPRGTARCLALRGASIRVRVGQPPVGRGPGGRRRSSPQPRPAADRAPRARRRRPPRPVSSRPWSAAARRRAGRAPSKSSRRARRARARFRVRGGGCPRCPRRAG